MAAPLSAIWDRGLDILNSLRDATTNTMRVFLGDAVVGGRESDAAELWQHIGFASRPPKAEKGKPEGAPQALLLRGARDAVIATRDPRGQKLAGELDYGETCVYGPGETGTAQGRMVIKKTGTVALYTRAGNTESGGGMTVLLDPATDSVSIVNSKGYGLVINGDGVTLTAGDSALTLKSSGDCSLVGKQKTQVDGASIVLGSVALPVVSAVLKGPAGILGTPALKVLVE